MTIVVHEDNTGFAPRDSRFYAYDDDTYDGAEDSTNRHQVGHGPTADDAIRDLLETLGDNEVWDDQETMDARRVSQIVAERMAWELVRALRHAVSGASHWRLEAQRLLDQVDAGILPEPRR